MKELQGVPRSGSEELDPCLAQLGTNGCAPLPPEHKTRACWEKALLVCHARSPTPENIRISSPCRNRLELIGSDLESMNKGW